MDSPGTNYTGRKPRTSEHLDAQFHSLIADVSLLKERAGRSEAGRLLAVLTIELQKCHAFAQYSAECIDGAEIGIPGAP